MKHETLREFAMTETESELVDGPTYRLTTPSTPYLQAAYDIQDSYEDNEKTPRVVLLYSGKKYRVLPFWDEWDDTPSSTEVFISHFIVIDDNIPMGDVDVEIKDIEWWGYDT